MTAALAATTRKALRLGAYLRLSERKSEDDTKDTGAQLEDCKAVAKLNGGVIVKTYVENDTSAFKQQRVTLPDGTTGLRVRRDVFAQLMRDLHDGIIDGFVGYHLDRIARQPRDLEDLIDLVTLKGVKIYGTSSDIDLATDSGILSARLAVMIANQSSRDTSRRVARWHRSRIEAGLPGGCVRPFGFDADKITHNPREAAAISYVAKSLIAGATLASMVRYLNEEGLTSTKGNAFTPANLRQMLRNPRLAGRRAKWNGKDWEQVTTAEGKPVIAVWEPIITFDEWEALQAAMKRGKNTTKGQTLEGARKYLLSGIARCGACGSAVRGVPSRHPGKFNYSCLPKTQGGCGGIARSGWRVDAIVEAATLTALAAEMAGAQAAPVAWAGAAQLERLEALRASTTARWKAGTLDSESYFEIRAELDSEIKALTTDRKAHERANAEHAEAVDVVRQWHKPTTTIQAKRAAVRDAFSAIVIEPLPVINGRKVKAWNPALIKLI